MPRRESSTIYIGKEDILRYVLETVMHLNSDQAKAIIKARGNSISMAVDVAEIVRHKYVRNTILGDVKIGTDVLDSNRGGSKRHVSFIEIHLSRPPGPIPAPEFVQAQEPAKPQHPKP
jgi:DNA-binding protein